MTSNELQLIAEIKKRKIVCVCGAAEYPREWMKRTQEKLKAAGVIVECKLCSGDTCQYLKVNEGA